MQTTKQLIGKINFSRVVALAAVVAVVVGLSGCVVYPASYGPPHYHGYYGWR